MKTGRRGIKARSVGHPRSTLTHMFRKRGTPAFLELLRSGPGAAPSSGAGRAVMVDPKPVVRIMPVARPAGSGSVTASLPKPLPVYSPSGTPIVASAARSQAEASSDGGQTDGGGGGGVVGGIGLAGVPRVWLYVAAAGVVVLSLVWVAAFKVGEATGRRDGKELVSRLVQGESAAKHAGPGAVADPLAKPANAPAVAPSKGAAVPPRAEPLPQPETKAATTDTTAKPLPQAGAAVLGFQPGLNYLVVATLRKADADEAAKYLSGQGLPMLILPERGIDPASSQANNVSWEVLVLNGYSSPLSATQAERTDLETRVKSLGRRWKAENKKAPTDFAQVFWKRFKGQ